ncbi:MAG: hypothetical protein JF888_03510 [Candidatus Dormibacteraeota bacterium]|uniref:Uncharacterized protein n=1 Tax=Candidatus Dormiibacter inghamiae TaxID=3127013 RepID=A0A934KF59_9BACT|nr:hypothetical protein [Candidatus Dormibacteraeota bacterium]MBJ7607550.1 hypothetical protein [Candidatus Dormibacteraeota bacterium]
MSGSFLTRLAARVIAGVQIALGMLFWAGQADWLVPVHMAIGLLLVIDLWAAVALALRARPPIALAAAALVWSLVMPTFGLAQASLLPGAGHVLVQLAHLLVGLAAVGLIEALGGWSQRRAVLA